MANTITNLIPLLFESLDIVSRELLGMIPAVTKDSGVERAAVNQTVNIFTSPAIVGGNVTPGQQPPDDGDAVFGNVTMTIQKSRYWPVRWTGEEQKSVGGQMSNVMRDQFAQAFRAATNEIELDLYLQHINASRAYGTAGNAPFATANELGDIAFSKKILEDNGCPMSDLQFVLTTGAKANLGAKQAVLFKVNEAGTADLLRNGIIGRLEGFDLHATGQGSTFTKGTGTAYTSSTAGFAIGATTIAVITGSGTILAGDVVTFAGDTNKYVVKTGNTGPGNIVLQEPGLRQALPLSAQAMTIENDSTRSIAFSKSAIQLATRLPALPIGPDGTAADSADDRLTITDPVSGLSFEVSLYRLYRRIKFEIAIAWGVQTIAPRHVMILHG